MTERFTFAFKDCGSVKSAQAFVESVFRLRDKINNEKLVYRGHGSTTYLLRPTIGRPHTYAGRTKTFSDCDERDLLHRFRRRAYPHFERSLSAGEALFIGRHYGLPSRILDWTANALYGLYFACISREKEPGIVWAMRQRPSALDPYDIAGYKSEDELFDAFLGDKRNTKLSTRTDDWVKVVYPIFNTPRIVAQDGTFTFHSNPWRALEQYRGVEFWSARTDIAALYSWRVEAKSKPRLIADLSGLGVTHRIVFPDLDGIARSLWETDVLWHGGSGVRKKTVLD
jgi:hypothetical protein